MSNVSDYDFKAIEAEARQHWDDNRCFEVREDPTRTKFYCLSMLPYPSGALHMGHVRNYTIGDVISRYQRMLGKNVLQPMGWDAFGLPAENAAIKNKAEPAAWTTSNIAYMKQQLQALGFGYDWSREFATCKPEYYEHEQRLFLQMYESGLVYRTDSIVNWDPVEQTVLANEQVVDGKGWRSGATIEQRAIPQWFFKITHYADELLNGLDALSGWPESVKSQQRNWIGRSEGLEIDFALADGSGTLTVYTTRPDTLCGVTFVSVAAAHPLAQAAAERDSAVAAFVTACAQRSVSEVDVAKQDKQGVALGIDLIHPLTGARVPLWAANFVLMGYGTGAVMAVPGHDQRDWEMATKYSLPITQVIAPADGSAVDLTAAAYTEHGVLVNSGAYDGLDYAGAFAAIRRDLEAKGQARHRVNFRLRDWGASRQRYWGCPIPMLYRADGSAVPVPADELPVVLPTDIRFEGVKSPIKSMPSFYEYTDRTTGERLTRETDTFDTFVESSWYYARYCSPGADRMLDERANYWLPVDQYIGGIEHAVMHLLYFRFWHKVMRDLGYVSSDEPAKNLLCQGMVVAETFYREEDGRKVYFSPVEVDVQLDSKGRPQTAIAKADGLPVTIGPIEKMSKSILNGVDPQSLIDRYGADTVRLFSMFAAPPEQSLEWSADGVEGSHRFLKRLWRGLQEHLAQGPAPALDAANLSPVARELRTELHETIAKVGRDVGERYHFNTAIAAVMEFFNTLARTAGDGDDLRAVRQEAWEAIARMLQPITPHLCHAMWQLLGRSEPLLDAPYPAADPAALVRDVLDLVVQVNGKLRGHIRVAREADRAAVEAIALADANVQRHLDGKAPKRVIVVPGKLVNVVI